MASSRLRSSVDKNDDNIVFINKSRPGTSSSKLPDAVSSQERDLELELPADDVTRMLVRLQQKSELDQHQFKVPQFKEHCDICNVSFLNFYDARAHSRTVRHRQRAADAKRRSVELAEAEKLANAPKPIHVRELFLKNVEQKVRKLNLGHRRLGRSVSAGPPRTTNTMTTAEGGSLIVSSSTTPNEDGAESMLDKMRTSILRAAEALKAKPRPMTPDTPYHGPWEQIETEFGETFYLNRRTGHKQWERPDEMPPVRFRAGMSLQCRFQGKSHWFDCVVQRVNSDGTFNVKYPDGDIERNVPVRFLRIPKQQIASRKQFAQPNTSISQLNISEAASVGDSDAVKNLLEKIAANAPAGRNADEKAQYQAEALKEFVNQRDNFYLRTPLHDAAHYGQVDVVRVLLNAGADPNTPDMYGKTAVQCALGVHDRGGDFQWVRCIRPGCDKWRKIPATVNVPERFDCTKNRWDPPRADCTGPQETGCPYLMALQEEQDRFEAQRNRRKRVQLMLAGGAKAVAAAEAEEVAEQKQRAEKREAEERLPPLTQRYDRHSGALHKVSPAVRVSKDLLLHSIRRKKDEAAAAKARITHVSTADGRHVLTEQRRKLLEEQGREHMLKFKSALESHVPVDWEQLKLKSLQDHLRTHIRKNKSGAAEKYTKQALARLECHADTYNKESDRNSLATQDPQAKAKRLAQKAKAKLDSLAVKEFRIRTEWNSKRSAKMRAISWLQRVVRGRLDRVRFRQLKEQADLQRAAEERQRRKDEKAEYYRLHPSAKLKDLAERNLRRGSKQVSNSSASRKRKGRKKSAGRR